MFAVSQSDSVTSRYFYYNPQDFPEQGYYEIDNEIFIGLEDASLPKGTIRTSSSEFFPTEIEIYGCCRTPSIIKELGIVYIGHLGHLKSEFGLINHRFHKKELVHVLSGQIEILYMMGYEKEVYFGEVDIYTEFVYINGN